ncbi:cytochrome P450 20A1-like [Biomphalaria glabrata]|uniref:Cytochrome P450 20A1-like n=1 Tax=Biomphalaria glabrata TaxID=6526 RepID=A0A9U8EKI3_BIOGL|nr:cytochrome P450 20A1-like [Biomphalaria glabrata]
MLDFVIFAVTFLAVLLIAIIWIYPSSKKVTTIPGLDPSTTEDGNLSDIARAGSLHEFLVETHARFGPITGFWWGQVYVVSIASPELFKAHANVFDKPSELFKLYEPLIGPLSIQYTNGSEGRKRRQFYDRSFEHDQLITYYEHFQKISHSVEKSWSQKTEHDHIPLSEEMFKYSIKAALFTLVGESFNDEKLLLSIRNAYDKAWGEMEHRLTDPVVPSENSPRTKQLDEAVNYLKSTVKKIVDLRAAQKKGHLLLDEIVQLNTSEEIISSDIITYLVEAFHTTANLLTWCIYFLATHKDIQTKLYSEIVKVLGDKDEVDNKTYGQLSYLNQVINETLRCAVITPWTARCQDFDTELGGHKVPKNTPVIQALGVVLQDETLWPLPNKFDPDRFSVEQSKNRSPYAFSPFGFAGKRKCPGYKFAYMESSVLLSTLLRRFEVSLCDDQVAQPVYGLVTHPLDEVWVKVSKRK